MLKIQDLTVSTKEKEIISGINLEIEAGKIHAIMGPNGSGKSTLSKVLAGFPEYKINKGKILFEINGRYQDIAELEPEKRSREGLFLAYQYPVEVPGVTNSEFLRAAFNSVVEHQGGEALDPLDFNELLEQKLKLLQMKPEFASRQLNVEFSGGEKKRNEILQMAVLNPRLAILDETDSGLDIDALRQVAKGIKTLHNKQNSIVLITHYQRILDYIVPDYVHILVKGKIVKSGGKDLALYVEKNGYEEY